VRVEVIEGAHVAGLDPQEHDPPAQEPDVCYDEKAQKGQDGILFDERGGQQKCYSQEQTECHEDDGQDRKSPSGCDGALTRLE